MSQKSSVKSKLHESVTSQEWIARAQQSHASCSLRTHDPQFASVFVRGKGSYLWDAEGNQWLDLICGYSASNFGHADSQLADVAREALSGLTHLTGDLHPARILLAEELLKRFWNAPTDGHVVFNSNGSRGMETALKAATSYRPGKILTFSPSFHGRSIATSALSETARTSLSNPFLGRVINWEKKKLPVCVRCKQKQMCPACEHKLEALLEFMHENSNSLSCVVVDPAITARGYLFPSEAFGRTLSRVTRELNITLIADEIQSGLGRCGAWLLSEAQHWEADMVVLGKSLGGGIAPISAVIGRQDLLEAIPAGAESETFAGSPFACRVGLAVLKRLAAGTIEKGKKIGARLREEIEEIFTPFKANLEVNVKVLGQGAVCAIDFGCEGTFLAESFVDGCSDHFIRVQLTGETQSRVVMLPPLSMTDEELEDALQRLRLVSNQLVERHTAAGKA